MKFIEPENYVFYNKSRTAILISIPSYDEEDLQEACNHVKKIAKEKQINGAFTPDEAGRKLLKDYLLPGETHEGMIDRVSGAVGGFTQDQAEAINLLMKMNILCPASPILSNAGTDRGDMISCFVGEINDNLADIRDKLYDYSIKSSNGGGIGTRINVREAGAPIGKLGAKANGSIKLCKCIEANCVLFTQAELRRASAAAYMHVSHPEIQQFIDIRRIEGDPKERALELHHGVIIPDSFMQAVEDDRLWPLVSPSSGKVVANVSAKTLWTKIIRSRFETGEPYIMFEDNVNNPANPYIKEGKVTTSNLCTEILLHTYEGKPNICCLVSINWDAVSSLGLAYKQDFMASVYKLAAALLNRVIHEHYKKLTETGRIKSLLDDLGFIEKPLGIGVMGEWNYLRNTAKEWGFHLDEENILYATRCLFSNIKYYADLAKRAFRGVNKTMTAVAPTASISTIAGTDPSFELPMGLAYRRGNIAGITTVYSKGYHSLTEEEREEVIRLGGSFPTDHPSYRPDLMTAYQMPLDLQVKLMAVRDEYTDQGCSNNLFIGTDPKEFSPVKIKDAHMLAWRLGVKTLYYVRTDVKGKVKDIPPAPDSASAVDEPQPAVCNLGEECRSCS